eukprot:1509099-Rhodomonas_salina.3
MVHGSGFRVQGSGFRVQGSGFTARGSYLAKKFELELVQLRQSAVEIHCYCSPCRRSSMIQVHFLSQNSAMLSPASKHIIAGMIAQLPARCWQPAFRARIHLEPTARGIRCHLRETGRTKIQTFPSNSDRSTLSPPP